MNITNYVAVAVVILLASIVYEFTVVGWFMAAQKRKQDERARRYPHRDYLPQLRDDLFRLESLPCHCSPLDVKDIPQVGPLQWGWINFVGYTDGLPLKVTIAIRNELRVF